MNFLRKLAARLTPRPKEGVVAANGKAPPRPPPPPEVQRLPPYVDAPSAIVWGCTNGHRCVVSELEMQLAYVRPRCSIMVDGELCWAPLTKPLERFPHSFSPIPDPLDIEAMTQVLREAASVAPHQHIACTREFFARVKREYPKSEDPLLGWLIGIDVHVTDDVTDPKGWEFRPGRYPQGEDDADR